MTFVIAYAITLTVGLGVGVWAKRWSKRTAAKLIYPTVDHVHGAWCHPSADGCPDRPGA